MTAPLDDFGGTLRQARERRGISLRQIAASTKISAGALEALERNDISKLPGGIFSRAFVRSYAVEVGLDPEQTIREFLERFDQEPAPSSESPAEAMVERDAAFETRRLVAVRTARVVSAVVGASLFVGAIFAIRHYRGRTPEQPAPQTTTAAAAVAPAPARADVPAAPEGATVPAVTLDRPAAAQTTGAGSTPLAGEISVDLHPTANCWISASADGKKLFTRVLKAGEHQTITFRQDAVVDVGDAGSFAYSVNGREGKPLGSTGQVRTLRLTPATIAAHVR